MTTSDGSVAEEIIRWLEVPGYRNVFALGCFARQVTFASQQTRALNLIWALFQTSRLAAGQRVAIVGAGLGGLTAAVGALTKGCSVDLYDQASQPCPIQRGNDIRFIHPNILRWPDQDAKAAQTEFPFLNWTAASARGVIKQIDLQWRPFTDNPQLHRFFNYKVNRLYAANGGEETAGPSIAANRVIDGRAVGDETPDGSTPGYIERSYDCVILAVGFGEERSVAGVSLLSYWENDSLHQETGRRRRSILVSGCGDGGLIDALRLRLRNFDHADFTAQFLDWQGGKRVPQLIRQLRNAEGQLRPFAFSPDISLRFQRAYDEIRVPKSVEQYFRDRSRSDTTVTLNSPGAGPLSLSSSLLNRYATYLAMRFADLRYLSGKLVAKRADDGAYDIALQRDSDLRETHRFDLVVVRHGPESAVRQLVPDAAIQQLQKLWAENEDVTIHPLWREGRNGTSDRFFKDADIRRPLGTGDLLDLARTTFESAAREFFEDEAVQAVAVGQDEGHTGFIVTLKPDSLARDADLRANVPVKYVVASSTTSVAASAGTRASQQTDKRRVALGVGIYNYSAASRLRKKPATELPRDTTPEPASNEGNAFIVGVGTLGCYAVDGGGKRSLVSTGDAVALSSGGRVGDQIFLEGQSPKTGHRPIATIHKIFSIPQVRRAARDPSRTSLSIVSARLFSDVVPDFGLLQPDWQIKRVARTSDVDDGVRVCKIGRSSGLTTGTISAFELDNVTIMLSDARHVTLDGCIEIVGERTRFSGPGDSGAVVVSTSGAVIGIVIAGAESGNAGRGFTIAFPLEQALRRLGLRLLPSTRSLASRR